MRETKIPSHFFDDERFDTAVRLKFDEPDLVEIRIMERWYKLSLDEAIRLRWKLADAVRVLADLDRHG